jgi:hypothetical protein
VRFTRPLAAETVLTLDQFHATFGECRILSRVALSLDRRTATLFYLEHLPSSARVQVTFDETGLRDALGSRRWRRTGCRSRCHQALPALRGALAMRPG